MRYISNKNMAKPQFYVVIQSDVTKLMNEVEDYLADGYQLHGSMQIVVKNNEFQGEFFQYVQPLFKPGTSQRSVRVME